MAKKLLITFGLAFLLNLVWEFSHRVLYLNYQGGAITPFILARAALADAVFVVLLVALAQKIRGNKLLFVIVGGLAISVAIEFWGLGTGRWTYNDLMPLIPILGIGLSPAIQLAVTGGLVEGVVYGWSRK